MASQIELRDVSRVHCVGEESVYALKNINVTIHEADYVSIMGPSGSGKSSLLNIMGVLDTPTQGHYFLQGNDITSMNENQLAKIRQHMIGFVFQSFHLVPRLTAEENIALPMVLAGIEKSDRNRRVNQALKETGLLDRASHRSEQLSGGQRQRVAIARAMIMRPKIILADEPTGNLDQHSGKDIIDVLEALNQNGITLIVVTHDLAVGNRAKRQIKMLDGEIVNEITVSEKNDVF